MQGIYILNDDLGPTRPKSKKQVKEIATDAPRRVVIEATSAFGNEYDGLASELPVGQRVYFVGPDPYTSRKFYGTLERTANGVRVT